MKSSTLADRVLEKVVYAHSFCNVEKTASRRVSHLSSRISAARLIRLYPNHRPSVSSTLARAPSGVSALKRQYSCRLAIFCEVSLGSDGSNNVPENISRINGSAPSYPLKKIRRKVGQRKAIIDADFGREATKDLLNEDASEITALVASYKKRARTGSVDEILTMLFELDNSGKLGWVVPYVHYKSFFESCKRARPVAVDEACEFTRLIGARMGDKRVYTMLAVFCKSVGALHLVHELPAMMREAGLKADVRIFTSMIAAYAHAGESNQAFEIYEKMKSAKQKPNEVTFSALVNACVREMKLVRKHSGKKQVQDRRIFWLLDRVMALEHEMDNAGVKPDVVFYNTLLDACRQANQLEKAFDVWKTMCDRDIEPTAFSFCTMISACGDMGDYSLGLKLYQEILKRPHLQPTKEVFTCAIHMCAQDGKIKRAERIFHDMLEAGLNPDGLVFAALMDVAARRGQVDKAFEYLEKMRELSVTPTMEVYSTLVGICTRSGLPGRAAEIYHEVQAKGLVITEDMYNAVADSYGKSFQLGRAMSVLQEMREAGVPPSEVTYGTLIHAAGQCGDVDLAFSLYEESKHQGLPPSEALLDMLLLICLMSLRSSTLVTQARGGDVCWKAKAVKTFREHLTAGLRPSLKILNIVFACLREMPQTSEPNIFQPFTSNPTMQFGAAGGAKMPMRGGGGARQLQTHLRNSPNQKMSGSYLGPPAMANVNYGPNNGFYESGALAIYEESQRLGLVQNWQMDRTVQLDLTAHPREAAQVAVLTLIQVQRRRAQSDSRIHSVTLHLATVKERKKSIERKLDAEAFGLSAIEDAIAQQVDGWMRNEEEEDDEDEDWNEDSQERKASKSGQAVARMLYKLKIPFKGSPESGKIHIHGPMLYKWLIKTRGGWETNTNTANFAALGGSGYPTASTPQMPPHVGQMPGSPASQRRAINENSLRSSGTRSV